MIKLPAAFAQAAQAIASTASAVLGGPVARHFDHKHPELRWDWAAADQVPLAFPGDFIWGVATAAHQVEGDSDNNNWSRWETRTNDRGEPTIAGGQRCGRACDHWNRYREDIELARALGVRGYRISLAWDKLEPQPGVYDQSAIDHYHEVLDAMHAAGMDPMVTLHHFTHPLWFEDMGSFEKADNLHHLVRFAERMFREYASKVSLWCTINEPAVFATQGWFGGIFPPGKRKPQLTAEVIANLVSAHARMYNAMKALPGGEVARIGLVKNMFQFDPLRRASPLDWAIARVLDRVFNGAIMDSLRTGRFTIRVPGLIWLDRDIADAPHSLDFCGLNYYSHFHVQFRANPAEPFTMVQREEDVQTDMPYPIYAEGFYRALQSIGTLGRPVYVTENGIADERDDRRALFIRRYLYALYRAMSDGVDVRGFYYWTLMDNFEWAEGYDMKFGLYAMDPDTLVRKLRDGARAFVDIVAAHDRAHGG